MEFFEKWIWLDKEKYPDSQTTVFSGLNSKENGNYTVAEFFKEYRFEQKVLEAKIRFSGDTEVHAFLNDKLIATGPAPAGGDFLSNERARPSHYATAVTVRPDAKKLCFFARVKLMPVRINEYSKGHGGFMLTAMLTFEDGSRTFISTDESWLVRKNGAFTQPYKYDGRILPDKYFFAKEIQNIWNCITAPIPSRTEEIIFPSGEDKIELRANEKKKVTLEFDKIYAGFLLFEAECQGVLKLNVTCFETDEKCSEEEIIFNGGGCYRGLQLHSVGGYDITAANCSDSNAVIRARLISTHYPVYDEARTVTSDPELNKVLKVCAHTLKQCRQMMHLDSPKHCEPLACTGDYYIESLMTAFSFGDQRLSKFDVLRTAELLRYNGGRMFHTTYSLIWVQMLYDVYMLTGDRTLLCDCFDAVIMLCERFASYIGENGLIENPPDYMFIDWIYIDGMSLHHPPKALGQTCLNIYYYGMLKTAEKIFYILDEASLSNKCKESALRIKNAVNSLLFDSEKRLYFEGLNTPTPECLLGEWMPQNISKRYYRKHANILAAYFGICEEELARELISKAVSDGELGDFQPFFAHFLLEAIYRRGLREQYTLKILERWKTPVMECSKGLAEGFIPPEPTYSFDHSHAWGGTPLYALPKALTGIEIVEAGYRKIRLDPSLLGLKEAYTEIPTPFGKIIIAQKNGELPVYSIPDGIEVLK